MHASDFSANRHVCILLSTKKQSRVTSFGASLVCRPCAARFSEAAPAAKGFRAAVLEVAKQTEARYGSKLLRFSHPQIIRETCENV